MATRLCVRTTAACRLVPLREAIPSTTSARSYLPSFGRFLGTAYAAKDLHLLLFASLSAPTLSMAR